MVAAAVDDRPEKSRYRRRIDRVKAVEKRDLSRTQTIAGSGLLGAAIAFGLYAVFISSAELDFGLLPALIVAETGTGLGLFVAAMEVSTGPLKWILAAIWLVLEFAATLIFAVLAMLLETVPILVFAIFAGCG